MKRWIQKPLTYIKRGITSLFVCAVVFVPVLLIGQWVHAFRHDPRRATPSPAMRPRSIGQSHVPAGQAPDTAMPVNEQEY